MTSSVALSRESRNSSVEICESPRRNKKILRNFDFFLPKFHFILPNFYFPVPWRIFVFSLEICDFLGRGAGWWLGGWRLTVSGWRLAVSTSGSSAPSGTSEARISNF